MKWMKSKRTVPLIETSLTSADPAHQERGAALYLGRCGGKSRTATPSPDGSFPGRLLTVCRHSFDRIGLTVILLCVALRCKCGWLSQCNDALALNARRETHGNRLGAPIASHFCASTAAPGDPIPGTDEPSAFVPAAKPGRKLSFEAWAPAPKTSPHDRANFRFDNQRRKQCTKWY